MVVTEDESRNAAGRKRISRAAVVSAMTREEFIPATKPRVRFWKSKDGRAYAWYVYALPQGQSDDWQNFVQVADFNFESDAKQLVIL